MERIFDIILSSLALLVCFPLMLPLVIILKSTGEGEIFFIQDRIGKKGKVFGLFKFATMLKDSPNIGTGTVTMKNDPRVLPIGKFLRKTKINELPQLLNILFLNIHLSKVFDLVFHKHVLHNLYISLQQIYSCQDDSEEIDVLDLELGLLEKLDKKTIALLPRDLFQVKIYYILL